MNTIFNYKGSDITFSKDGEIMVNATQMAKPFDKRPVDWLRLPSTISFIETLTTVRKLHSDNYQAFATVNGGVNPGTWLHEDVALEFARWLSPTFAIWCNDRIKELLKHGATALNPEDLLSPEYIITVMTALKKERAEKEAAQLQLREKQQVVELQERTIMHQAPKVQYYDKVLDSARLIATNIIANDLGVTAITLNKYLKQKGVIYRVDGSWVLTAKYREKGLAHSKTYPYIDSNGQKQTAKHLYWTEKGVEFITMLFQSINVAV